MPATFAATDGRSVYLLSWSADGRGLEATRALPDCGAFALAIDPRRPSTLYAGLFDEGIRKSEDAGQSWADVTGNLPHRRVTSVAVSPAERTPAGEGVVYAGTEPSALFRSADGGRSWTELTGLQEVPSRPRWSFPPRPWTSHVRWIAPDPHDGNRLFAGIELGGLLRSVDGGQHWEDHKAGAHTDVHMLATGAPGRVYEAGGQGAAFSVDGGASWQTANDGLGERRYCWAVAVDPLDPDLWYVSAAAGPGRAHRSGQSDAAIFRRTAAGWERIGEGLPDPLDAFPYALVTIPAAPRCVFAGLASGEVYASRDAGQTWAQVPIRPPLPAIDAMIWAGGPAE